MKKTIFIILSSITFSIFADNPRIQGSQNYMYNNPTVNSKLYSGAIFSAQNQLTTSSPNYNKIESLNKETTYSKNNAISSNYTNSPNVNSGLYSGALFDQQNQITGTKGEKYNIAITNKANNPNVNSRLYSGALLTEENKLTN